MNKLNGEKDNLTCTIWEKKSCGVVYNTWQLEKTITWTHWEAPQCSNQLGEVQVSKFLVWVEASINISFLNLV